MSKQPEWPNVGDRVDYCSVIGEPPTQRDMTVRAGPQLVCGTWSVWLKGKAGCVAVAACTKPGALTDELRSLSPAESLLLKIQQARTSFSLDPGGPNGPLEGMLTIERWVEEYFQQYPMTVMVRRAG